MQGLPGPFGPLSPEALDRAQAYYEGKPGVSMSAPGAPAPAPDPAAYYGVTAPSVAPPTATPAAPPDAGPLYDYTGGPPAPATPPAGPKPFSWNAPGFENQHTAAFSGTGPMKPSPAAPVAGSTNADPAQALTAKDMLMSGETPKAKSPSLGSGQTTPAEDAQFNAYVSFLNNRSKPKPAAGGGGSANADPFGVKDARAHYLGTYDMEAAAVQAGADAEGQRSDVVAARREELARQQMEDAAVHAREIDDAQRGFDQHMSELQTQLDTVRAKKIDPDQLTSTPGGAFMAVVGGVLGGVYMGMNKLDHNPFIDDLNRRIDRSIAVQEKNLDNEQKGIGDKMNLLREQRATFKDHDMAMTATRSAMYQATINSIEAEAAKYDNPVAQARAQQAIQAITREKDKNDLAFRTAAQQQSAAAAAATASQTRALQTEMRKAYGDTYEHLVAAGVSPQVAEEEALRQTKNAFGGGAGPRPAAAPGGAVDPIANIPKDQRETALKEREAYAKAEAGAKRIEDLYTKFDKTSITSPRQLKSYQASIATAVKAGAGPGMSSDKDYENFIEPNLPLTTDSAETLGVKRKAVMDAMRASAPTPTLDQHNPSWRGPAPVPRFDVNGKPKP